MEKLISPCHNCERKIVRDAYICGNPQDCNEWVVYDAKLFERKSWISWIKEHKLNENFPLKNRYIIMEDELENVEANK